MEGETSKPNAAGSSDRKPVVVACSGPSLREVDVWSPGYDVAAVSTAIICVPRPTWWILVDPPTHKHGAVGLAASQDATIPKIMPNPDTRTIVGRKRFPGMQLVTCYNKKKSRVLSRTYFDGKDPPVIRPVARSTVFAVQWLVIFGEYTDLIFAGCDLVTRKRDPYAYSAKMADKIVSRQNICHSKELAALRAMAAILKPRGVRLWSWTETSPINSFMERFDGQV